MVNTIDMQDLRYLNMFGKITQVRTRFCFKYNNTVIFCVPKKMISKSVGEGGKNIKRMSEIIKKRIKIIPGPRGIEDARVFIESIVNPVTFKDLEITDDEIILTAGVQSKAALIGRNKRRFLEMQKIVENFFKKNFKII